MGMLLRGRSKWEVLEKGMAARFPIRFWFWTVEIYGFFSSACYSKWII